jgi:Protein of unknown function (DUF1566)
MLHQTIVPKRPCAICVARAAAAAESSTRAGAGRGRESAAGFILDGRRPGSVLPNRVVHSARGLLMPRLPSFATALIVAAYMSHAGTGIADARCFDDSADADQIRAARTAIDATCRCFAYDGQPGRTQSSYLHCAMGVVGDRVAMTLLRSECTGTVARFYRQSICGRVRPTVPLSGPHVPCVSQSRSGAARCALRRSLPCLDRGGAACFGSTSCIDAADTDGDLHIGLGDSGGCTPGSTYTDNGDGTITDDQSGLMWERKGDDDGIQDWYTWDGASTAHVATLNAMSFAAHSDWRLPTIAELQTLIRPGSSPAVAPEFDAGCVPGCTPLECSCTVASGAYWSSTTVAGDPVHAWDQVGFGYLDTDHKSLNWYVRAVRGGA